MHGSFLILEFERLITTIVNFGNIVTPDSSETVEVPSVSVVVNELAVLCISASGEMLVMSSSPSPLMVVVSSPVLLISLSVEELNQTGGCHQVPARLHCLVNLPLTCPTYLSSLSTMLATMSASGRTSPPSMEERSWAAL